MALFDLMSSLGAGRPEVPLGKGGKNMKKMTIHKFVAPYLFY